MCQEGKIRRHRFTLRLGFCNNLRGLLVVKMLLVVYEVIQIMIKLVVSRGAGVLGT